MENKKLSDDSFYVSTSDVVIENDTSGIGRSRSRTVSSRHSSSSSRETKVTLIEIPDSTEDTHFSTKHGGEKCKSTHHVVDDTLQIETLDEDVFTHLRNDDVDEGDSTTALIINGEDGSNQNCSLILKICSIISLSCLTGSGAKNYSILQLPLAERLRLHIFTCVFSILVCVGYIFIECSSIITAFPINWPFIDGSLTMVFGILYLTSSSLLLQTEELYKIHYTYVTDESRVLLNLASVFGFLSSLASMLLAVVQFCGQGEESPVVPQFSQHGEEFGLSQLTPTQ
ncbi:uncharacterized protein LOC106461601 isoform X2 [Limulus polyphemus]|uniref:Uncharacterized protein LOC106461601 isoform X2 n=1 Tax=Limulus polyphemus TaxID=6850 RepID=A0ABM1SL15_LIMPO|nr:uncharacterized protein LOC106461601 isoform X2 [Limulus polyphemus]